ncbi:glycoside hydrolase family 3 protein [Xylariaceae sp. FL0594]|nr:glycoside hydrolase family 3 protein [Xylariaceae sp. FL0594]
MFSHAIFHYLAVALFLSAHWLVGWTKAEDVIMHDSAFYGLSPPVYPTPQGEGTGDWANAYARAKALVSGLSLEEKVSLTGGIDTGTACSGSIPAIPRVNFSGLCLSDAGNGLRSTDFVSAWPSGIHVGARCGNDSWNRELAYKRAIAMGQEFRAKGVNILLGPVVGPLGRVATGGRNWEGFSNDPYLCGALAYDTVQGVQSTGVITSTKHFIGNEQETNRNPEGNVSAVSSNIDDKTMHELYLWPFQDALRAGTGNIMCSYNRVNNSYGCSNSKTMNGLLKTELGFQGFVVTDWGAHHAGVATALAGLDMAMPSGEQFWGNHLITAVKNGSVPESRVDDMVTRIIATWYKMGQDQSFESPGIGMPGDLTKPHQKVLGKSPNSRAILFQGAVEGHVLVKNKNNALPLQSPQLVSLFGYSAKAPDVFTPGGRGWNGGASSAGSPGQQIAPGGTLISGGGSGGNQPAYVSSPFEALSLRAQREDTSLYWDFVSGDPYVDAASDVCIVVGNAWASEGSDRSDDVGDNPPPPLHDDFTDGLILNVARKCANTVVVLHNAGVRLVDTFVDHPNVTAVIFAHLPGQDSGSALVGILYGDVSPSGKLPYSVPMNETDFGGLLYPDKGDGPFALFPQSDFAEGSMLDYRAFEAAGVTPRFEFGFGMGYAAFEYQGLGIEVRGAGGPRWAPYPTGEIVQGGREDLWDVVIVVTASVTNTGHMAAAEVAQLYVVLPSTPPSSSEGSGSGAAAVKQLRGFAKPVIEPGETATVEFFLTRRDLSTWDVDAQEWLLQRGDYGIFVGSSSRELPLVGTVRVP